MACAAGRVCRVEEGAVVNPSQNRYGRSVLVGEYTGMEIRAGDFGA